MADSVYRSPILSTVGAVGAQPDSADAGVAWHYGDPLREQKTATVAAVMVDRSHRGVLALSGPQRLSWLHTLSSQHVADLADGESAESLSLDVNGRVEDHLVLTDIADLTWIDTERSRVTALLAFLQKMVFWSKVEPRDAHTELAVISLLGPQLEDLHILTALGITALPEPYRAVARTDGGFVRRMPWPTSEAPIALDVLVPRDQLTQLWSELQAVAVVPAGMWAFEALRVAALRPRLGLDTDDRTLPHEVGWIGGINEGGAVHLDKGCYRGQETVARIHNLGKPPRHLVLLHLDGAADSCPRPGSAIAVDSRVVGRVGTVIDHFELGPIALALVKRTIPVDAPLTTEGVAAAIDPRSVPQLDTPQPGRIAIERLRGQSKG
ncbi:MAG: YgfZ/GcvT domain-containing protein [Mycobacteriaceae bacterium]